MFIFNYETMTVYKLLRVKNGKLYPLYVESDRALSLHTWLEAHCGELTDETHVKASGCGGRLALRPGFHCTKLPWTDWIGERLPDGTLAQRKDTVWCECEVAGVHLGEYDRVGLREVPKGFYLFKTNSKQIDPWIISGSIRINRILSNNEVAEICREHGVEPQPLAV